MQTQQQTQWCWAACASSVCACAGVVPVPSQCELASRYLPGVDCCTNPLPPLCNCSENTQDVLSDLGLLIAATPGSPTFARADRELALNHVLVLRLRWLISGGGHAMVVTETRVDNRGAGWFHTEDPYYGPGDWLVATFPTMYHVLARCHSTLVAG